MSTVGQRRAIISARCRAAHPSLSSSSSISNLRSSSSRHSRSNLLPRSARPTQDSLKSTPANGSLLIATLCSAGSSPLYHPPPSTCAPLTSAGFLARPQAGGRLHHPSPLCLQTHTHRAPHPSPTTTLLPPPQTSPSRPHNPPLPQCLLPPNNVKHQILPRRRRLHTPHRIHRNTSKLPPRLPPPAEYPPYHSHPLRRRRLAG